MSRLGALGARLVKIGLVLTMLIATFVVAAQSVQAQTRDVGSPRLRALSCAMTRTGEYERADPAPAGLDPAKLQAALNYAVRQASLSIKVFRHGCLLGEGLLDPLFQRIPANNYGQTKAIAALVTGIALHRQLQAPRVHGLGLRRSARHIL